MSLAKQVNHNATKINRIWHLSSTMVTRKQNLSQDLRNQTIKNIQVCPRQLYSTQNVGILLIKMNSVHAH